MARQIPIENVPSVLQFQAGCSTAARIPTVGNAVNVVVCVPRNLKFRPVRSIVEAVNCTIAQQINDYPGCVRVGNMPTCRVRGSTIVPRRFHLLQLGPWCLGGPIVPR